MILIISVLSERSEDVSFYRWIKAVVWPQTVYYWGPGHQGLFAGRHKHLDWNLERNFVSSRGLPNIKTSLDLDKHIFRLKLLAYQTFELGPPSDTIIRYVATCERILETLNPDLVIALNPLIPHTGVPREVAAARNIPTLAFERGFLPRSFIIDPGGYGGFSPMAHLPLEKLVEPQDFDRRTLLGQALVLNLKKQKMIRGATTTATVEVSLNLADQKYQKAPKVLILGGADLNNAIYPLDHPERKINSPVFESTIDLVAKTSAAHAGITLFKPHPNTYKALESEQLPDNVVLTTNSIEDLLEWADVIVVNGTSLEYAALAANKPVVNCGVTLLTGKEICYEVETGKDLSVRIRQAWLQDGFDLKMKRFYIFISYLVDEYLVFPESAKPPNLYLNKTLKSGGILQRGALWIFYLFQAIRKFKHAAINENYFIFKKSTPQ